MTALAFSVALSLTPPGNTLTRAPGCTTAEHVVGLLPFGAGQLVHGDTGLGVALATSQAAALALNLGSYIDGRGVDRDSAQRHVVAQYASLAIFGVLWSLGALQAQSYCPPAAPALASGSLRVASPLPRLQAESPVECAPCGVPGLTLAPCPSCRVTAPVPGAVQLSLGGMWAHVDVDGERVLDNQMGAFSLDLSPGDHVLRFSQPRAHAQEVRLTVDPASPPGRVVVKLEPLPARLHIIGAPAGGLVRIADRRVPVGAGPVTIEMPFAAGAGPVSEVVEVLGPTGATVAREIIELSPAAETSLALEPQP